MKYCVFLDLCQTLGVKTPYSWGVKGVRGVKGVKDDRAPSETHRRDWGVTLLCGAVTTFSGSSKDPSRPQGGEN